MPTSPGYTVGMKWYILFLLLAVLALGSPGGAAACPSCRDALATTDDKEGTPLDGFGLQGEAISASVLFMLAVPFTLVSLFGVACYRLRSRPEITLEPASLPGPVAAEPPLS
jgi:hypothetical protein